VKKLLLTALTMITGIALALAGAPSASAHRPDHVHQLHVVKTLSSSFVGPLQFAVAGPAVFVADSFTSTLSLIGLSKPIATGPGDGGDIAGVAVDARRAALAYTSSNADHSTTSLTILQLGHKKVVADLAQFERTRNPDRVVHYGVKNPSKCVRNALNAAHIPVNYTGEIDSHPYAVVSLGGGNWAVADAGGNDVLKVDRYGHVSLLSVLPAQPLVVSPAFAAANDLPKCTIGITYKFEAVPTDVELGPGGGLYVTTLPGGGEGPNSNPGSVYRISRCGGAAHRVATGFNGATNLAIDRSGHIFVAEIGSGTVSEVVHGKRVQVLELPGVVAVEYANGRLYASTAPAASDAEGPGTVVVLGPSY
jgi:hypothetical protein